METVAGNFENESDGNLLGLIGLTCGDKSEKKTAEAVFREFLNRHKDFLSKTVYACARGCATIKVDAKEIVILTFTKAYREAEAGRFRDRSGGDHEKSRVQVRAWLCRIAKNLICDAIRGYTEHQELDGEAVLKRVLIPTKSAARIPERVEQALSQLKEMDRDILLTHMTCGVHGKDGPELPPDIREKLMQQHSLTREALRQRKSRALSHLRAVLKTT
jgi:DNA-directed RNA polymerase specialized sigma24 family protein